ncbi:type II toxin-antitoxin system VapC family toxin [Thiocystis minor]|uniref:type II toxin-antitoxin system VapC family toxin n=1 Tax=Thiocystis minor TaxID=61597 RepID=UPI001A90D1BC|nr:type II toxin-antitoxin system VapC family toxin [Thiocystis minor]
MWLPDTNVWIAYLNPRPSPVKQVMRAHPASDIYRCDVVKAELFFGAYKSQRMEANLAVLDDLYRHFCSLPFDGAAAREFGKIRAELQRGGTPIGPYDLQIAAIALAHHFTLVTHNIDEFKRVRGLRFEDWESGVV